MAWCGKSEAASWTAAVMAGFGVGVVAVAVCWEEEDKFRDNWMVRREDVLVAVLRVKEEWPTRE